MDDLCLSGKSAALHAQFSSADLKACDQRDVSYCFVRCSLLGHAPRVGIDKPFLNSPAGTGTSLKLAWGLHPWMVLWVTYSLLAFHFPFAAPEVQPQAGFPLWWLLLLGSSLQLGEHHTTSVFHFDPILPCPRLQNVTGIGGTGFRLLPQFLKPVLVIIFMATHLSSAGKSVYILFIPLPEHLKAFSSSFRINQTICVPCTMRMPLGQLLSARGKWEISIIH